MEVRLKTKAIVILSGGQDSVTCLYWAQKQFDEIEAITFKYGQKHDVEVRCAAVLCEHEEIKHTIVDISFLNQIVDSALVSNGDVSQQRPDGLPASFVPNRNQLFITLAHAYAQKVGARHLVIGVCQTDYSGYPDCRENFINAIQSATNTGAFGEPSGAGDNWFNKYIMIHTPLMHLSKAETWKLAEDLDVIDEIIDFSHTCYNGDHQTKNKWGYGCGKCPACELRQKGWEEWQIIDIDMTN